jgi:hypothetical protein
MRLRSYETSEVGRFIEVRTTNEWPATPLIVPHSGSNERRVCLYGVFEFTRAHSYKT